MIDKKVAQTIRIACFLIQTVFTFIGVFAGRNIDNAHKIVIYIIVPVILVLGVIINVSRGSEKIWANRVSYLMLLFDGFLISAAIGSMLGFVYIAMVSTIVVFLMKRRILLLEHALVSVTIILVFNLIPNIFIDKQFTMLEVVATVIVIIAMDLLLNVVKKQIIRMQKRLYEQDRTSDEILKIIEAKADEAREATKSKSDFLASMSHEIRTPINSIIGMNEMILRESRESFTRDYASDIQSSGNMLLSLINNILDFSKIESGKMQIIQVDYEVSSTINDLIVVATGRAQAKGLSFIIEVDDKMPRILHGDEVRIKQIISNILSNAVKYTDNGYVKMLINFEKQDERTIQLTVSITDTGHGMKKADMERLFKPFERIDELKNRHVEGTGLGMSITQQLLNLMGSKLEVSSVYGKGSTFSFTIRQEVANWEPLGDYREAVKKYRSETTEYRESFTAPAARLLVVDDIQMNLNVFVNLLKKTGVKVDTALSGRDAIEMAREKEYNIIFMDHMMPELDGIETFERMRKDKLTLNKDTPVVALTANAVSGARESYIEKGFIDYLSKPVDSKRLEIMVQNLLPKELIENSAPEEKEIFTTEEAHELDKIEKLRRIQYLDVEQGLSYTGDAENYEMVTEDFYTSAPTKIDEIRTLFENGNIKDYTIQVHALKSTARMIGDNELSEMAKALEMAGKDDDIETISRDTEPLLERYGKLYECLKQVFARSNLMLLPTIEMDGVRIQIENIRDGINNFDFDKVDDAVKELDKYRLPEEFRMKFRDLKVMVANVALDEIEQWLENNFPQ